MLTQLIQVSQNRSKSRRFGNYIESNQPLRLSGSPSFLWLVRVLVGLNDNHETMRHLPIHSWVIYLAMVLLVTKPNSTNSRMGQEAVVCNPLKRAKAPSSERTLRKHHFPLLRPHHCCKNDHPWKLSLHQAIDVIGVMLHQVLVPGMGFRSTHTISVQQNDVKFNLECYNKRT